MAGSWKHAIDDQGRLLNSEELISAMDSLGDWAEFAEEAYGMIYFLATALEVANGVPSSTYVGLAHQMRSAGVKYSPGLEGTNVKTDQRLCGDHYIGSGSAAFDCILTYGHSGVHKAFGGVEWDPKPVEYCDAFWPSPDNENVVYAQTSCMLVKGHESNHRSHNGTEWP